MTTHKNSILGVFYPTYRKFSWRLSSILAFVYGSYNIGDDPTESWNFLSFSDLQSCFSFISKYYVSIYPVGGNVLIGKKYLHNNS